MSIQWVVGDSLQVLASDSRMYDLAIADPPYATFPLINEAVRLVRARCVGATFVFMYPEDLCSLAEAPDQVLFWVKPVSTKNTRRRYSRFVEAIAAYDLDSAPFNESHWSIRTGVFTDTLVGKTIHPFQKPESLIEKLVYLHTQPGDSVLDPFAGSGTVSRVCERMGRSCVSIEIVSPSVFGEEEVADVAA